MLSIDSQITANKSKNEFIENKLKELEKHSAKSDFTIFTFLGTINRRWYPTLFNISTSAQKLWINYQGKHIAEWKPKGLSDECFKLVTTSGNNLAPLISYYGYKKKGKI